MESKTLFREVIKQVRLPILFGCFVAYAIGVGLYFYLGRMVSWDLFWLGSSILLLFTVSAFLLNKHFSIIGSKAFLKESIFARKNLFLLLGITTLAIGTTLTVWLISQTSMNIGVFIFLAGYLIPGLLYALPPFSFQNRGYGVIFYVVNMVVLSPTFGYFLQSNELHPTLMLLTFPSVFLLFALFLANKLESYYPDYKSGTKTIMTVLGWQKGMSLHNLFVLFTYFSYAVATIVGLPWRLSMVVFLSMPFAAVQFWEMTRIREGLKPRWTLLKTASIGSVSALAYFILFFLWLG